MICFSIRIPGKREMILPLTEPQILVGRGEHCDIVLRDETADLEAFCLEKTDKHYVLKPIANDILLNGKTQDEASQLHCGDLVVTAESKLLYIEEGEDFRPQDVNATQTISLMEVGQDGQLLPRETTNYALQYTKGDAKRILRLTDKPLTIGRHPSSGLILNNPSVSSNHARIERQDDEYVIEDLNSRNGIRLNGQKVERGVLYPGTRIRIGKEVLSFKEIVPGPPPTSFVNPLPDDQMPDDAELPASTPGSHSGSSVIYEENWADDMRKLQSESDVDPYSPTSQYTAVSANDDTNSARGIRLNLPAKKELVDEKIDPKLLLLILGVVASIGILVAITFFCNNSTPPENPDALFRPAQQSKPMPSPESRTSKKPFPGNAPKTVESEEKAPPYLPPVAELKHEENLNEMIDKTPDLPQDAESAESVPSP